MRPHAVVLPCGYAVSDDPARLDMDVVFAALGGAYWATDLRRDLVERSFAHSLVLGIYDPAGATVGFGRVVTDRTYRAHLADVMVLPPARGRGLGVALVSAALGHPELATVRTWTLTTADAHTLYARFGFRASEADPNWMVRRGAPPADPTQDER